MISIPELQSLYRRIGPGDLAENVRYELGIRLLEREVLPAKDEKEEVGPLRRHIVEYGGLSHSRHEPLHRHKDGHHRVWRSISGMLRYLASVVLACCVCRSGAAAAELHGFRITVLVANRASVPTATLAKMRSEAGWVLSTSALRGAIRDRFFPWTICALVAPRRFVYSYELGWNVEDMPAWARYRKVFSFYDALDHLADAHGYGPFPGPGECWNIGPAQRRSLYPTLQRWFGIPIPYTEVSSSLAANLERRPVVDGRPVSDLAVLTPAVASELHTGSLHELAHKEGQTHLDAARVELEKLTPQERRQWLKTRWANKLGDIEPNLHPEAVLRWSKEIPNGQVEGITLTVEPGIIVPMLLLRPQRPTGEKAPVVVAVADGGKDLFVAERSQEIEAMLKGGTAVCLPDVRGTGETSPDPTMDPDGDEIREHLAASELMLGDTLLGKRLKDLRTVIDYLEGRQDLDAHRIGLWGDSFTPANPARLVLDEQVQWQVGPQIQQQAEPLGGLLAVLGALYHDDVRTIAVHGGLASYLSVCDDYLAYVPADVIVPGILEVGDIADVAAALVPRSVLLSELVDGRDRLLQDVELERQLSPLKRAYQGVSTSKLVIRSDGSHENLADWFHNTL